MCPSSRGRESCLSTHSRPSGWTQSPSQLAFGVLTAKFISRLAAPEIYTQSRVPSLLSLRVRTHTISFSQFRGLGIAHRRLKLIEPEPRPTSAPLSCFPVFKALSSHFVLTPAQPNPNNTPLLAPALHSEDDLIPHVELQLPRGLNRHPRRFPPPGPRCILLARSAGHQCPLGGRPAEDPP